MKAFPGVAASVALASFLLGCAAPPPRVALGIADPAEAGRLLGRLWTRVPGVWRIRQSVLFEGHGMEVPLQGFLELDTAGHRARLAGLDELGVTLFTVTVTPGGVETGFLLPGAGRRGDFPAAVASGVRRVYLDPLPDRGDALRPGGGSLVLARRSGGRETSFAFDAAGRLLSTEAEGEGESWRAEYGDYQETGGVPVPRSIVLEDRAAGWRLGITQVEIRREESGGGP